MSSRGFSRALRAMSRSVGTAITYDSSYSGVLQAVYLDAELGARAQQHVEQVLAGGPLAVQQVGADGAAFRSSVASLATDVIRDDLATRSYLLHCERSSGQYLFDMLLRSGAEFGIEIDGLQPPGI